MASVDQLGSAIDDALSGAQVEIEADATAISDVQSAIDELDTDIAVGIEADGSAAIAEVEAVEAAAPDGIDVPVSAPGAAEAQEQVDGVTDSFTGLEAAATGAIAALAGGGAIGAVVSAFGEADVSLARVTAQIEGTGGVANVTAGDVLGLSSSIQNYSGIADEATQNAAALLLSFKGVRNEAGAGNDIFDRTLEVGADISRLFGRDLSSTAVQLGRALQDPAQGLNRLARSGITFSEAEKQLIVSLAESGDLLAAQGVLLDVVEGQVGSVAEAYGATLPGQIDVAKNALGDILEVIGGSLASVIKPAVSAIAGLAEWFTSLPQPVQDVAGALGAFSIAAATAAGSAIALKAAIGSGLAANLTASARSLTAFAGSAAAFAAANPAVAVGALVVALGGLAVATGNAEGTEQALADLQEQAAELAVRNAEAVSSLDALGQGILDLAGAALDLSAALQQVNALSIELGESGTSLFEVFGTAAPAIDGLNTLFGGLESKGVSAAGGLRETADAEAEVAANTQALLADLPTLSSAFDDVQSAAPGLAETFGILEAESDPAILSANLQAQADVLNAWADDLTVVANEGPAGLFENLRELGPEAAGLTARIADALRSGDLTEAARLAGTISNLEDASTRVAEVGGEAGAGFSQEAQAAIDTGGQAVAAAAQATGDNAAAGIGAGFEVVSTLLGAQMGVATATVAASGVTLATTAGTVGRTAGLSLSQGFVATAPALIGLAMTSVSLRISSASFSVASSARTAGAGIGRALGQGIRAGIDETVSQIAQAARNAVLDAADAARAAAQVSSPSKVWTEIGAQMGAGMAVGLAQAQAEVVRAAEAITFAAASPVAAASPAGGGTATFGGVNVNVRVDHATPEGAVAVGRAVRDGVAQAIEQQRQAFDTRLA